MARDKSTVNTQMPRGKGVSVHGTPGEYDRNHAPFDQPRSSGGQNDMPNKFFDDLGGANKARVSRAPAVGTVAASLASPGRGKGMPPAGDRRPKRG